MTRFALFLRESSRLDGCNVCTTGISMPIADLISGRADNVLQAGRDKQAVSTSAQISPAWKEEVNRRLAEHRGRKGSTAAEPQAPAATQTNASRRAMEAAARVAARYANAPSYSDVLANEARAALRAAEAASRAALQAQAAAQSVLAGIEAANAEAVFEPIAEPVIEWRMAAASTVEDIAPVDDFFESPVMPHAEPGPELVRSEALAVPAPIAAAVEEPAALRWDLALPVHPPAPVEARAARGQDIFQTGAESWWRPAAAEPERVEPEQIEVVEPQAIPANLIEFPRELVATRKARPRLAEGLSAAADPGAQLSIFEVDPISISTEPAIEERAQPAQAWTAPTWSGMELEAQSVQEVYEALPEPAPQAEAAAAALEPAPATLRLMALVVDGALVAGSLLAAATVAASRASVLPGLRSTEIGLGVALVVVAALYQMFFFTLGRATPGMKYAQIRLTTFEGMMPVRAERYKRMAALLVSVLPAGLGLAWALFDEDHLSWHDRLSRTYLCKK